ncbi:hypothetical protein AVEN_4197-1 [Araneus ventricosus]|uniref:Uncharacterized protein n=1 Tax=Araneus ventricosus TaxID=182803 RepID=A0A4Y2FDA2_ARAVE|nr:hypothetical protein AVEN_4197-1 [Araneus ventricosus]
MFGVSKTGSSREGICISQRAQYRFVARLSGAISCQDGRSSEFGFFSRIGLTAGSPSCAFWTSLEDQGSSVFVETVTKMLVSIPNFFSAFVQYLQLIYRSSREGICISVRGSFAMLDFAIIFLKPLYPVNYMAYRFLEIQKLSQGSMITPQKQFSSIEGSNGMFYRFNKWLLIPYV